MKCNKCGGDLNIEQAFCPHCGNRNQYFEAHRKDMASYEQRFSQTEEEVTKKANITGKKAVFVTIVAVFAALILAEVIVLLNLNSINYYIVQYRNNKNSKEIAKELASLEDEGDYLNLGEYYYKYAIGCHDDAVKDFDVVGGASEEYVYFVNMLATIAYGDTRYDDPYNLASRINNFLITVYHYRESAIDRPEDPRYAAKHFETINNIIEEMHAYLREYLDIDRETAERFPDMNDAERLAILQEKLEKVMDYGD